VRLRQQRNCKQKLRRVGAQRLMFLSQLLLGWARAHLAVWASSAALGLLGQGLGAP
jgi:hypothetical protein